MRVLVPHRVVREYQGHIARFGESHSRIAHEKRMMGMDDVGSELIHGGGDQCRRGNRDRKLVAVEMLNSGNPNDMRLLVGAFVRLRSDDQRLVVAAAKF